MKYIIVNRLDIEVAILFPETVNHSDAVNRPDVQPISAGFCKLAPDGSVSTHGQSTSLKLSPRPQDAGLIEESIAMMGFATARFPALAS